MQRRAARRYRFDIHLIPGTRNLRRALLSLDAGDEIRLEGFLVDASGTDGFRWTTSLSREDEREGSCEILFVESAQIESRIFR